MKNPDIRCVVAYVGSLCLYLNCSSWKEIVVSMKVGVIGVKGMPSRVSGLEIHAEYLAQGLSENGMNVVVFCRKQYCSQILKKYKKMEIVYIPSINTKHLDAISYSFFATIVALLKNCDTFWFHALGPSIMACIPKLFRRKVVCTVHGLDWKRDKFGKVASKILKIGEWSIAKFADEIIVLNSMDAAHFYNNYGRKCKIIPNGVTVRKRKKAEEITQKFGVKEKEYFLFASRIVPEKKVECLIKAYMNVKTNKKLLIAGKGVHTDIYESEVRKLASDNPNIIFTGFISGNCLKELYSNAYAYILPSTIEGQSLGLLEAMSYGNACIVSNIDENVCVIKQYGLTFENGNEFDLSQKLAYLLENEEKVYELGKGARELCLEEHRWEDTIKRTIDVFEKVWE